MQLIGQTIPNVGVDVAAWMTEAITAFGAVVVYAIGGFFAFKLVELGVRLIHQATGCERGEAMPTAERMYWDGWQDDQDRVWLSEQDGVGVGHAYGPGFRDPWER